MTKVQHNEIKAQLIHELNSTEHEIEELIELCKPISPQCALGDLARFELMHDQTISEKTLRQANIRKSKLEYALSRIDKENFGLCIECEEAIAFERLLLLPEASHCIRCASELNTSV